MSIQDTATKQYVSEVEVFADVFSFLTMLACQITHLLFELHGIVQHVANRLRYRSCESCRFLYQPSSSLIMVSSICFGV